MVPWSRWHHPLSAAHPLRACLQCLGEAELSPSCVPRRRWYRDPTLPIPRGEITRFPHGVLEVKLSLPEGQKAPEWVQDLLDSGYLTEARARPATPGCCHAADLLLSCSPISFYRCICSACLDVLLFPEALHSKAWSSRLRKIFEEGTSCLRRRC